jgi:hypothetical protein
MKKLYFLLLENVFIFIFNKSYCPAPTQLFTKSIISLIYQSLKLYILKNCLLDGFRQNSLIPWFPNSLLFSSFNYS